MALGLQSSVKVIQEVPTHTAPSFPYHERFRSDGTSVTIHEPTLMHYY